MSRERMIRVPKDVKAMYDFDYGVQGSDQMEEVVLTEEEFIELDSIGVFDLINEKCQVIIDDYEEEIIELEKIPVALEVIKQLRNECTSESLINLKKILEKALGYKTLVSFEF